MRWSITWNLVRSLDADAEHREYKATVATLTEDGTIQKLKLEDVIDTDGTLLSSFGSKTISELDTLSMDDIYLRDLYNNTILKRDFTIDSNYQDFLNFVDIDSFIDYCIFDIFFFFPHLL